MTLTLFTLFTTAIQTFSSGTTLASAGSTPDHLGFSDFGMQLDYELVTPSQSEYGYNYYIQYDSSSGVQETEKVLIQNGSFVLAEYDQYEDENIYGSWIFDCDIPEDAWVYYGITEENEDDAHLFSLWISPYTEDYNYATALVNDCNINNYLFNVTYHFHFDFWYVDTTDHIGSMAWDYRYGFDYEIPLYKKNYGYQESAFEISPYLSALFQDNLNISNKVICTYSVSFRILPISDVASEWYSQGYLDGKNDGISIANANTFTKLLSNIIDVPILYLRKLFGYEVLGVNIYAALATVMSLIVALAIFRFIRGVL